MAGAQHSGFRVGWRLWIAVGLVAGGGLAGCCDSVPRSTVQGIDPPAAVPAEDLAVASAPTADGSCQTSVACEDGDPCTEDRCIAGTCVAMVIPGGACCDDVPVYLETFDESGGIAFGLGELVGEVGWTISDQRATSPPSSLYFGDPAAGTYDNGLAVGGEANTPSMKLPLEREPRITFRLLALIEPDADYDQLTVMADLLDASLTVIDTVQVLDKGSLPPEAFTGFALIDVPMPQLAGHRVRLRFGFDSVDHLNNDYEGVYVDDLEVRGACPLLLACEADAACDDGDPCTANACSPAGCVSAPVCGPGGPLGLDDGTLPGGGDATGTGGGVDTGVGSGGEETGAGDDPGAGGGDDTGAGGGDDTGAGGGDDTGAGGGDDTGAGGGDDPGAGGGDDTGAGGGDDTGAGGGDDTGGDPNLDPADPCTAATASADCCTSDADCEDGDPVTLNVCEGASCVATLNPDACLSDAECDDGEPCTVDHCAPGTQVCEHVGGFGAACCVPGNQNLAFFDQGTLEGVYVTDNLETGIFWTPDSTRSTTGAFSLYCGDQVTQTYAVGERVKSSATTPLFEIPAGGHTTLILDLFKDTRTAKDYDVFQVLVLRDGALLPVWSSKALPGATTAGFKTVVVPLDAYAGQSIQVRLVFDSVNGTQIPHEGTYVDSLRAETHCY